MRTVLKPLLLLAAGMILALQAGFGAAQSDEAAGGDQIALNFQDVNIRTPINIQQEPTPTAYGETASLVADQITQAYKLQHASVQELVPVLRPLLPPTSHFAAHAPSNTLLSTDTRANIRRILGIIGRMDLERPTQKEIHVMYLEHAKASDLVDILNQVSERLVETESGQTADWRITVQADEGANALVIHARPKEFPSIESVIKQLDIKRKQVIVEAIITEVNIDRSGENLVGIRATLQR